MLKTDKDALICDFAETYHIYDIESLSIPMMATLAVGLRDNSRIRLKMSGQRVPLEQILLATLVDRFTSFATGEDSYTFSELLMGVPERENDSELETFDSAEAFEARRNEILRRDT